MPDRQTYKVTFPDGHVETFDGPDGMSQLDQQNRAIQERSFSEGRIPTTWLGGAAKDVATNKPLVQSVVQGAGYLTGQPEIVAAGPLAAEGAAALANKQMPSLSQGIQDAISGVAQAYGPAVASKWLSAFAKTTVPHVSPISGQFVKGVSGSGIMPYAARTAGELAQGVSDTVKQASPEAIGGAVAARVGPLAVAGKTLAAAVKFGVSREDIGLVKQAIDNGFSPYAAARSVANGDANITQKLISAYQWLK